MNGAVIQRRVAPGQESAHFTVGHFLALIMRSKVCCLSRLRSCTVRNRGVDVRGIG